MSTRTAARPSSGPTIAPIPEGLAERAALLGGPEKLRQIDELEDAVVAAGMDGALLTVVAEGGTTALMTMLSACAPGIGVVIDNGCGAGHLAAQFARWAPGAA